MQATAPVRSRPDRKQRGQFSVYSTTTTLRTDRRAADNKGLKEMAGEVVNQTFVLSTYIRGKLTVRASKPPLL